MSKPLSSNQIEVNTMQNNHLFRDSKGVEMLIPLVDGCYQLPSNALNYVMSIRTSFFNMLFELEKHNTHLTNLNIYTADIALRAVDKEAANNLSIFNSFYLVRSLLQESTVGLITKNGDEYPLFSHFGKDTNLPTLLMKTFKTELQKGY